MNPSPMKKIRFSLEYLGARLMLAGAMALPFRFASGCGAAMGWLAWTVFRIRREVGRDNIMRALGVGEREAERIGRRSHMGFGRSVMEGLCLWRFTGADVRARTRLEGREILDEVRELGRGGIVFLGHFGNWELLGATFTAWGYPLTTTVGRQSNPHVDRMVNDYRRRHMEIIYPGKPIKIVRTLRGGGLVSMVADQDAGRDGLFVEYFGRLASAHRGPAAMAVSQECPVVFAWIRRVAGTRFVMTVEGPFRHQPGLARDDAVAELTQRLNRTLEERVREYPEEYFWAHRRWKTRPPQESDQSEVGDSVG
jgi:KDO2-lipid IV(A) lauroyltransferase